MILLSIVTRNWRNLLVVLANLPFALVGGVLAVFGTGGMLSLGSMVGFVTVFGITVRNSILIIAHYEYLVEAEGSPWKCRDRDPRRGRSTDPDSNDLSRDRARGSGTCDRQRRAGPGD